MIIRIVEISRLRNCIIYLLTCIFGISLKIILEENRLLFFDLVPLYDFESCFDDPTLKTK